MCKGEEVACSEKKKKIRSINKRFMCTINTTYLYDFEKLKMLCLSMVDTK